MHWIDPNCLNETRGTVTQFLLNPNGELGGFILGHTQQVNFPPHLSKQVAKHIEIGHRVSVRGLKPRSADVITAISMTSTEGVVVLDKGPHHDGEKPRKPKVEKQVAQTTGTVKMSLYGPKGELRGALLDNGTSLHLKPHAAKKLATWLKLGAHIRALGHDVRNKHGHALEVDEIAEWVDQNNDQGACIEAASITSDSALLEVEKNDV